MSLRISSRAVSVFLAGLAGSCLVGLAAYGAEILNPHLAVFQFVTSGAIGGALAAAIAGNRRDAVWAVAGLSLVIFVACTRPGTGALIFRDLLYIPTLVASVWLSWVAVSKFPFALVGRVLVWGVAFALCHFAMFGMLTVVNGVVFDPRIAYAATRIGGLVGLGVGLGIYIAGHVGLAELESVR